MTYDDLIETATRECLYVSEAHIPYDGVIYDDVVVINSIMPSVYKKCALAEEIEHFHYTVGNIADQSKVENVKQENFARGKAYEKLLSVENIKQAIKDGYTETWEIAEQLEVAEEFLKEAVEYYRRKGLI